MISLNLIGDIMLGRFVAEHYTKKPYKLISDELVDKMREADVCIANLESPISSQKSDDSLKFSANADLLEQFKWVDCFSLSNNHINDFGTSGMAETLSALEAKLISYNGLYEKRYNPYIIDRGDEKIALITCADMMNYEFSENCPYKTLRINKSAEISEVVKQCKEQGYFVILFAHAGMLFTRFPNPVIRDYMHQIIDDGADCIVTAHPHCLGGYEVYKEKLIVYSLGDFLMDGASFRRRKAGVLNLVIVKNKIKDWTITPVQTDDNLKVHMTDEQTSKKMLSDFEWVGQQIAKHSGNYMSFYRKQYKKELIAHSWSTIQFEYHRRGLLGMFRTLSKRFGAVAGMTKRVFSDRSMMSYDADAVSDKNTSINDIR